MIRRIPFLFLFAIVAVTTLAAQADADMAQDVFAPFVSRLRVAVRDPQVRITWRDAEDLSGGRYEVLRSTVEITTATLPEAVVVAVVEPGTETYLDTPTEAGSYFYAVVARDPNGRRYDIFVPFRNKTIRPVSISQLTTEEDLAAAVYGIAAQVEEGTIIVRYETSRTDRTLAIYRSTSPITSLRSLEDAVLVRELSSSVRRFQDFPVPGVPYYYAVVDQALIERGSATFEAGQNTIATPIRIAVEALPDFVLEIPPARTRRAPLPILQFAGGFDAEQPVARPTVIPPARAVTVATQRAIDQMLILAPAAALFDPLPTVLPEERAADEDGAARTLAQIATGEFASGSFGQTITMIDALLRLPLSARIVARARFYRAQALYFEGHPERALMDFLIAMGRPELYDHAKNWVDGILNEAVHTRLAR